VSRPYALAAVRIGGEAVIIARRTIQAQAPLSSQQTNAVVPAESPRTTGGGEVEASPCVSDATPPMNRI